MISTYAELQTEVNRWSHRSDMTARVPDFIALAEARMNDALILKDMEVEETLSSAIGANYVALPTGYVSPKKLWIIIDGERKEMWPVAVTFLEYDTDNTIPSKWAVDGANLRFDVPADKVYSMPFRFVKKSNLSDSVTTNPLLLRRPDLYLAGTMVELARYTRDQDLFGVWEPRFIAAMASVKAADSRNKSVAPLRTEFGGRRSDIFAGE